MRKYKKIIFVFLITALVAGIFAYAAISFLNIPDKIVMIDDTLPDFGPFYSMHFTQNSGILKNGEFQKNDTENSGEVKAKLKMFGVIDLKDINININKNKKLIACGNSIGVKLYTDGILVVGLSEFEDENGKKQAPAKKCGVKTGDLIKKVNGKEINKVDEFIKIVEKSKNVTLEIVRNNDVLNIDVEGKVTLDDGKTKLGIWARDSTAGIGTMTFYDPESGYYGALGHGITDVDTGEIMPSINGRITGANIISIKKGEKGVPGELQGIFLANNGDVGTIDANTKYGIYGRLENTDMTISSQIFDVASKEEITVGSAYILSNIEGQAVKKYDVEIQKIMRQNDFSTKGMVIKITDENLIKKTGGIVQGMSGSPIIQNGKIIGAVTHVFVNDPTRGYGIFIENMLTETEKFE